MIPDYFGEVCFLKCQRMRGLTAKSHYWQGIPPPQNERTHGKYYLARDTTTRMRGLTAKSQQTPPPQKHTHYLARDTTTTE
ncbi:hypothetical protein J6590_067279 [Homalodisca vitripennis]|nr:hypothetical protein J6590_067279 [Homalodisca vitripennis]